MIESGVSSGRAWVLSVAFALTCAGGGTTRAQETITGTLGDIAIKARAAGLEPPVVAVIGEVVRLSERPVASWSGASSSTPSGARCTWWLNRIAPLSCGVPLRQRANSG